MNEFESSPPDGDVPSAPGDTAEAQAIIARATAEAELSQSDAVGAEHLLSASLDEPGVLAAFQSLGFTDEELRERFRTAVRRARGRRRPRLEEEALGLSSQARRLLQAAEREAAARHEPLSGAHLALAAVSDPRGVLARLFSERQLTPGEGRRRVSEAAGLGTDDFAPADALIAAPASPPDPPATPARPAERPRKPKRERKSPGAGERREARQGTEEEPALAAAPSGGSPDGAAQEGLPVKVRRPLRHLRRDRTGDWGPLWRRVLLLAIPAAIVANMIGAAPGVVFLLAALGVLPLAGYMGDSTEHLAARTGPTIGGLLNATFGNAAELIIAIVALNAGLVDLVKASITGSILGNMLLILGLSLVAGGLNRPELRFNRTAAGVSAGMLAAAVVGLIFPALFHATHSGALVSRELWLSESVAVVLILVYLFSLLFTLKTHRRLLGGEPHPESEGPGWSVRKAVMVLTVATVGIAFLSEILVHAVDGVTATFGLSEMFLGLIIIPLIGNAAEHAAAVTMAHKGKMDLALQIAYGSSTQIALLVAPLLVFVGLVVGAPMNLVFTPFEVVAVFLATIVASMGTSDGESHWFEGVMLLAVYALVAIAAFFV